MCRKKPQINRETEQTSTITMGMTTKLIGYSCDHLDCEVNSKIVHKLWEPWKVALSINMRIKISNKGIAKYTPFEWKRRVPCMKKVSICQWINPEIPCATESWSKMNCAGIHLSKTIGGIRRNKWHRLTGLGPSEQPVVWDLQYVINLKNTIVYTVLFSSLLFE